MGKVQDIVVDSDMTRKNVARHINLIPGDGVTIEAEINGDLNSVDVTISLVDGGAVTDPVHADHGGTGFASYTVGQMLYASATDALTRLAGNTTTTKKFLRSTGTGSAATAPAWDTLVSGDLPAAGVTSAKLDPTTIQYGFINLTASQIKALHGTPITVQAAAGAGTVLVPIAAGFDNKPGGTQFTAGSGIQLQFNGDTTNLLVGALAAATVNSASRTFNRIPAAALALLLANTAIEVAAVGTEFATGNGTMRLHFWYQVIALT